ncbi:MAG TPA: CoA transferase, partial [Acidimicrobiales bacterium]|nr:CoA transferase [Acidimicrobiales bacterium]
AAWAATRTAEECEQAMLAAGTPAARYRQVEESFDNEQLQARGTFIEAEDRAGVFRIVASPYRLRGIVDSPTACGPEFPVRVPSPGEHTREVLTRILGEDDASRVIESGGASAPEDDQ